MEGNEVVKRTLSPEISQTVVGAAAAFQRAIGRAAGAYDVVTGLPLVEDPEELSKIAVDVVVTGDLLADAIAEAEQEMGSA